MQPGTLLNWIHGHARSKDIFTKILWQVFWNFLKNDTCTCLLRKVERFKKDYVGLFCERNAWPKALSTKTSRKFRIDSVVEIWTEFQQKTACIPTMRFRSLFRIDESLKKVKQKDQTTIPQPYEIFLSPHDRNWMKIYLLSCYRYVLSFIALRLVTNLFTNVFYRSLWLTDQKSVRHFLINTLGKQKCQ